MTLYRVLFGFDALVALIILYFFAEGLHDRSVSSNGDLWTAILAVPAAVLGGGWWLHAQGQPRAAIAVLLILAVPGLLYALFILSVLIFQSPWN